MALEDLTGTGKFISALNPTWPTDDDWVDEGDNHLRGIKNVLKNTFPNVDGAVTLTDEQLNRVTVATPDSRIINGNFAIDQRNAGAGVTVTGGQFGADRWPGFLSGTGIFGLQRYPDAATSGEYFLAATVQTIDASLAAGDVYIIQQAIEGVNIADLSFGKAGAKAFTFGCNIFCTVAGTYPIAFRNYPETHSYIRTVALAANTWTPVVMTIPGPTVGTWLGDNGKGMTVGIAFGAGSQWNAPAADSWQAGNYFSVAGCTNLMATSGAQMYLKNARLYPGTIDYGPCQRLYADELRLCQRYYEKSYNMDDAAGKVVVAAENHHQFTNAATELHSIAFTTRKRAVPSVTFYNPATGAAGTWRDTFDGADKAVATYSINDSRMVASVTNTPSLLRIIGGHWVASAEL